LTALVLPFYLPETDASRFGEGGIFCVPEDFQALFDCRCGATVNRRGACRVFDATGFGSTSGPTEVPEARKSEYCARISALLDGARRTSAPLLSQYDPRRIPSSHEAYDTQKGRCLAQVELPGAGGPIDGGAQPPMPSDEVMAAFRSYCEDCHAGYGNADKSVAWQAIVNGDDGRSPTHYQTVFARLDWDNLTLASRRMPRGQTNQTRLSGVAGLREKMLDALRPVAPAPAAGSSTNTATDAATATEEETSFGP
jgi:hypothetical protein